MRVRLPFVFLCVFLVFGCTKSGSSSGPNITLKDFTSSVTPDGVFNADFNYSQSGGNLSNDSLVIIMHRYNLTPVPPDDQRSDSFYTNLPQTPDASTATFNASLSWANISYGIDNQNDTVDFSFILIDNNGKHSDTVKTGKVIILQQ